MIPVLCSNCGLSIKVPSTVAGRSGTCFGCGSTLVVPEPDAKPKEVLYGVGDVINDRYVIDATIGKGGMGEVFKAHDKLIDEEVALKFMNPKALKTQRGQQLFIKEAQIARRLRHENIVSVHDVSTTTEGLLYLSMELLNGVSLREYLRKLRMQKKHLDVRLGIRIILQILSALENAHTMVIHRDLKPENVMLLPGERVKVLDFGLALAVEDDPIPDSVQTTADGKKRKVIGTLAYASPEQKRHQSIDMRSDLYTVGQLLMEVLTLRTPVDEQVNVLDVRNDVAPSIAAIINKAMMEEKERRYQSAAEFYKDLDHAYTESYKNVDVVSVTTKSGKVVDTQDMVFIEGGSFMMGTGEIREEAPEHEAHTEAFYMDKYPVTFSEYSTFIEESGYTKPKFWDDSELNGPRQPITGVTFAEAMAYAEWAGKQLPTEVQWECAARGKENRKYPWGNLDPDPTRCNYGDYLSMPSIVNMHDTGATPDGVHDMAGNVYEWTLDSYAPYRANAPSPAQSSDPRRVVRGGSWRSGVNELTTTYRKGLFPETQLTTVGFRCVIPASQVGDS